MPVVTLNELTEVLKGHKGCSFVTMYTLTLVTKMNKYTKDKRPNPYYNVTRKRAKVNGSIGFWYERCVNHERGREDKPLDFVALEHAYAEHIPGCPLTFKRDDPTTLYLPILDPTTLEYRYEVDGVVIANDIIEPWLTTPKEGERQGLIKPRRYRNYLLTSIIEFHGMGEFYTIEH